VTEAGRWRAVILGYVLLHALLRLSHGPGLYWDEAEALFHARRLAWGYGPQPPLYFWLQWGLFQILGEGRLALVVLRDGLFAGALLALLGLLAREAGVRVAGVSVLVLGLFPVFSWTAQTIFTHSVLAFLFAVLATGAFLQLLRAPSTRAALAFGLLLGLGTLSKLNFLFWVAALVLAALLLPEWRARLRPGLLALALVPAALLATPYAVWAAHHPAEAGASLPSLGIEGTGVGRTAIEGTLALLRALAAFAGPAAAVLAPVALAARKRPPRPWPPGADPRPFARLLLAALGCATALIWLAMLASGATDLRERWFLPVGWALAPVLVIGLWPRLAPGRRRVLATLGGSAWALGLLAVSVVPVVDPGRASADFRPLAAAIAAVQRPGMPVLVDAAPTGGNLALVAPALDPRPAAPDRWPRGAFVLVITGQGACPDDLAGRLSRRESVAVPRGTASDPFLVCVVAAR
jgi:4-amino-4-deoxy-L-arabinose transferase-like glycosyltransferase